MDTVTESQMAIAMAREGGARATGQSEGTSQRCPIVGVSAGGGRRFFIEEAR